MSNFLGDCGWAVTLKVEKGIFRNLQLKTMESYGSIKTNKHETRKRLPTFISCNNPEIKKNLIIIFNYSQTCLDTNKQIIF